MENHIAKISELFKAFGDETRVRIILALDAGELNVSQIVEQVNASQTAVSHQLRVLKQAHLVKFRRDGKNNIYSLADNHIKSILDCAIEHVEE